MSGSLSIPNTFATQSGNVPVSQLDTNLTTVRDYINQREITLGTLASRPAAGVAGRLYCATDTSGGTLYEDTGSTWTQIAAPVSSTSVGGYLMTGFSGLNNLATPNTQFDMSADLVQLRSSSDGTVVVRTNTGTVTNNVLTAGSTANGRDQAGTFSSSSWVHFYWIWNGATLATLSSATPPPVGPALPSGYTHWCYAAAVRFDGSSHLVTTTFRDSYASIAPVTVRSAGAGTGTEQQYDVSASIPPNNQGAWLNQIASVGNVQVEIRNASLGVAAIQGNVGNSGITVLGGRVNLNSVTVFFIANAGANVAITLNGYWLKT